MYPVRLHYLDQAAKYGIVVVVARDSAIKSWWVHTAALGETVARQSNGYETVHISDRISSHRDGA